MIADQTKTLESLAANIVERAKKRGADAAEVYVRQGVETEISVRNGEIEQLGEGGPKSVGVRVWRGDRAASTYATDFSDTALDRVVQDAIDLAALTDPVPESALLDPARLFTGPIPDLDLYDATIERIDAAEKLELARATEAAALASDERVTTSAGASYGDLVMAHALANSNGFCAGYAESFHSISAQVIAPDEGGKKRNGMWYSFGRHRDQLDAPDAVGRVAGARAVAQLGAGPVPTRALPVVFDPYMASRLVGLLFSVLTGGAVERRASYLADRLGETICSPLLTLIDDPTIARAPGSRPFDGEGHAATRTAFVEEGVLRTYALNAYSARKLGLAPTGHASRPSSGAPGETSSNLFLAAGDRTPESLIADIEYGFYCESLMGFGFTAATGDFSRGASGRLIENGKLTRPVSEVTLSANFGDLFARLDAVANDLVFDRSTTAPTIRVSEMTLAGT